MTVVAAVDIGASSGRVLAACLEDGVPVAREIHRFRNGPVPFGDRWVWPIDDLLTEVTRGLALAATQGARACGIDTWALDYAVIDPNGRQMGPVYAYRDGHHVQGIPIVRDRLSWADQYRITGIQDMPINTIYQIVSEDPNRVSADNRMLLVPDFINHYLTGFIGTEITNASTTSLVDPRLRNWAPDLLTHVGIPAAFLPDVHEPGRFIDHSRIPQTESLSVISVATHDTASAFAGTPIANREDAMVVSLGTWALVGYESTVADPNPRSAEINLTHELGVEGTVRCLRNVVGMWLFEECRRSWEATNGAAIDPAVLLGQAADSPGFLGIIDVDHPELASPGQTPAGIKDKITGRLPEDRAALVRILLDSLVARLASQITAIEAISERPRPVLHVVGGASRIDFLMQWLADATDKEVIAGPVEAASLGNAAVQWCVLGEFTGISEARKAIADMTEIRRKTPSGNRERWREFAGLQGWEI